MAGCCPSSLNDKAKQWKKDWEEIIFGRPERHNPEGSGPSGRVCDDYNNQKNYHSNDQQIETYHDPNLTNPQGPNYNPNYY